MEPIVTTIVTRDVESSLDLVTSFFIARLSDAEKLKVGALISDCADEASALGLNAQEKLFRFAEVLWGGAAIGTEEMAEACATKTMALITGYHEQKKVNGHRASMSPEWQLLVKSNGQSAAAPVPVEAPAAPEVFEAPPAVATVETVALLVEAPAAPAAIEAPAAVEAVTMAVEAPEAIQAPAMVEAVATPAAVEAPAVRRRQTPPAKSAGRGRKKTT